MSKPYTFYVHHIPTGKKFYGVRYGEKASPETLGTEFFGTGPEIEHLLKEYGKEGFKVELRKTFDTLSSAREWKKNVLRRLMVDQKPEWINKLVNEHPNLNKPHSKETRAKMSEQRKISNYARSKFVYVNGVKMSSDEAHKKHGLNHYMLRRCIVTREHGVSGFPDRETAINNELNALYKRYPNAPTKNELVSFKENRVPANKIAEKYDLAPDTIRSLMFYHEIGTKFDQIDQRVHLEMTKEVLQSYLDKKSSASYIGNQFGVSPSFVLQKMKEFGLETVNMAVSTGEMELKDYLEFLGLKTERRPKKHFRYEIDVFVPDLNVGFEYNGIFWHGESSLGNPRTRTYHQDKYLQAKSDGIRLIQIWDVDWNQKNNLIKEKIKVMVGKSTGKSIGARMTQLEKIKSSDLREFYDQNHIQGYKSAKNNYVLKYENEIVAALSMNKNKIERYATSHLVAGGFPKLLKYAISDLQLSYVETFADLCWSDHENNQYIKNGFKFLYLTRPNYFWCKGTKKYSRISFQKHKLKGFENYSDAKSEYQIMTEAGYYRVFDAGNAKFRLDVV